jgi:hypothetical protein
MHPRLTFLLRSGAKITCTGIVLAVLGPFGSYLNAPLSERLLFWLTTCWAGLLLYGALVRWLLVRWQGRASDWAGLVVGALVASIPEAWLSHGLAFRMWPHLGPALPPYPLWYAQTAVLGLLITLIVSWSFREERAARRTMTDAAAPTHHGFAEDIADISGIVALQIEDHYVRVHRAEGSRLILMPLKRAIRAMGDVEGLQTHRSWWVARAVVAEVSGTPRSMQLRLTNGLKVPVARSAVALLREAGWLAT